MLKLDSQKVNKLDTVEVEPKFPPVICTCGGAVYSDFGLTNSVQSLVWQRHDASSQHHDKWKTHGLIMIKKWCDTLWYYIDMIWKYSESDLMWSDASCMVYNWKKKIYIYIVYVMNIMAQSSNRIFSAASLSTRDRM